MSEAGAFVNPVIQGGEGSANEAGSEPKGRWGRLPAMKETDLPVMLHETGALLEGHFRLSSGLHSPKYVQCARLLMHPRDASRLGQALGRKLEVLDPGMIAAPALGGLIIGYAVAESLGVPMIFTERKEGQMQLRRGFTLDPGTRVAIVEDVVTTGKSTRETAAVIRAAGGSVVGFGSILNRSGEPNPFDLPYESLLTLSINIWSPETCPLCQAGVALESPGSRFTEAS